MQILKTQDRGERKIETQLSPSVIGKISREVYTELNQLLRKELNLDENSRITEVESIEATQLLQEAIAIVEKELSNWVQGYSPMRWLWMIRRLPVHVFSGKLKSTAAYDQSLAEILSARSKNTSSGFRDSDLQVHYDISGAVPKRLAKFCEGTRYLSNLHSSLRWAGKGSVFHFSQDHLLKRVTDRELERAVNLYDQRCANSGMPFPRGGTKLANLAISPSTIPDILRVDWIEQCNINVSNELMQSIGEEYPINAQWMVCARFMPNFVSMSPLRELQADKRIARTNIWSGDTSTLAFLLRIAASYVKEHRAGFFSLLTRGYLLMPKMKFVRFADKLLELHDPWLEETLIDKPNLSSGIELLAKLEALQGIPYPLNPGPVIHTEKDLLCLDLFAASRRLDYSFEYSNEQDRIANARAFHFELSVQKSIDASQWKPKPEIASIRGLSLRHGGNKITDIDSIGEKDDKLLIVDCKSIIYGSNYDVGDYRTVRNAQSEIIRKVQKWREIKEKLNRFPIGDNYDFSKYRDIVAIVCTPGVVFVPIGVATEEIEPNLKTASSLVELERWLGIATSLKD